jgi:hypothetical protein
VKEPALTPEDVTWEELRLHAEGNWTMTGPDSGGGKTLYRYKGQLFIVGYGDESSLPGGAEQVIGVGPDNTPGFPPRWGNGHTGGCHHIRDWEWDSWSDRGRFLRIEKGTVHYLDGENELWTCPVEEVLRPESRRREDVLRVLGPAVLDEMLLCAERQRLATSSS